MEEKKKEIIEVEKELEEDKNVVENQGTKMQDKTIDGMTIASMILGILGAVLLIRSVLISFVCGVLAIIFAAISRKNNKKSGMTTAGLVLGVIDVSISVAKMIFALILLQAVAGTILSIAK